MSEGHADKLGSVEELLIKISENMTDGKQDMDVYNKFYSVLERYMAKVKAEVLTLVLKYIYLTQITVGIAFILG